MAPSSLTDDIKRQHVVFCGPNVLRSYVATVYCALLASKFPSRPLQHRDSVYRKVRKYGAAFPLLFQAEESLVQLMRQGIGWTSCVL
jgi:hypothetical protein